jgi:YegS/Rv2252/BmrU family lipid kinase
VTGPETGRGAGIALVVNPTAGGGRARRVLPGVVAALRAAGAEVDVVESRGLDHAVEVATSAARDGALVAALGGDGMVGALAGAVAAVDGRFGVVPAGRGNDFARTLGLPSDPVAAARVLLDGRERRVDLGVAAGRPFVGVAGIGFDSEVNQVANATTAIKGRAVYVYATLRVLGSWRPAGFEVTVDGTRHAYTGYMVSVANSPYYGGGMRVAPFADLTDGALEVVMTHHIGKARFLATAPKVFTGRHVDQPSIHCARGREVRVEADRPFTVYADGDPVGSLPIVLTVRPAALRVVVPAAGGADAVGAAPASRDG